MKKMLKKSISVLLSLVIAVTVIPMGAYAADSDEPAQAQNEAEEAAYVLEEETELRTENTKYFRMSDGTVQAAQYSVPVHFEQNGEWVDYDNSLTETDTEETESSSKILKDKDLINHTADYNVRLSKKTNGKKFVRIEKDGYKISWYYTNADKSTANIYADKIDDDPTTLENLSSTVRYENVYKNTDFEYIIGSDGLKENIILKSKKAPDTFTSVYKANGLAPVQADDKTIELRSENGTVIYTITAPFMEDAQGEISEGITLTLTETKNNTFTVKTTLDSEWLQAENREYPVIVDPVLKTNQSANGVQSAFVSSQNPNKCYKASGTDDMGSLYVGNIYGYGQTESYMKFENLPALGIADKVVDARLYLGLRHCDAGLQVDVKRLTENWNEKTVTWNNGPHGESNIADYMTLTEDTDVTKFREVEITDIVRGWYSGDYANYGISLSTEKTSAAKAWFYSINYTTYTQNRPVLVVSYRNMSGYEDYWSYTEIAAGRGGVASVNNYNGNLIFSQPITQDAGGNLMPVNLSVVYNSNKGEAKYGFIGSRVQTNYQMYLVKAGGELAENGYKYYFNDADGTIHWFYFENGSTTEGKDEDGLGYKIKVITVGSNSNEKSANCIITDKDDNKMYFDDAGKLLRIENAAGIASTITYKNNQIVKITDGAEREYKFVYSTKNAKYLAYIEDPAGRRTAFDYLNGNLTKIMFADGESVTIEYNEKNQLRAIYGIDGTKTKAGYDKSAQERVNAFNFRADDDELLEQYKFEYSQNETTITDLQNRTYTYQFNDFGQTTGIVSNTDGSAQFFELGAGNSTSGKANKLLSESRVLQSTTNYIKNPDFRRGFESYWSYINDKNGASVTLDTGSGNITNASVKVVKSASNTGRANVVQTLTGLPAGTYTLSAYIFTNGKTLAGDGVQMFGEVRDAKDNLLSDQNIETTTLTDGWERRSVTFYVPANCSVKATMGLGPNASGTVWFDDIQLERSANASSYNLVENSAFTNSLTGWESWSSQDATITYAGLSGFSNCAKINGTVNNQYRRQRQKIYVSGKKGDVFSFGTWAYAASAPLNDTKSADPYSPTFNLGIDYYDNSGKWLGCVNKKFNPDVKDTWQFLSNEIVMPADYGSIAITFTYDHNVNNAYQTGAFCYKEQYGQTYDYDKDGNVQSVVDIAKSNSTFSYYGNQMAKMLNPSGSKYLYNYNSKKQLTNALSSDGLEYGFHYDSKGNADKVRITSRKPATKIKDGETYYIVNAYSGHAINAGTKDVAKEKIATTPYERNAQKQQWIAEYSGKENVFYLKSANFSNQYMDVASASSAAGAAVQIHSGNETNAQRFKLVNREDGTFTILTEASSFKMSLNGQYGDKEIIDRRELKQGTYDASKQYESQKWYFYPAKQTYDKTIVTETKYTENGNFVSKSIDERGNETAYNYDETKGTLTNVTNANGTQTEYTYDANNNSLLSVSSAGVTNSYSYEDDRLQTIDVNNALQYKFTYDKFGRTISNAVGNNHAWKKLSTLEYNQSGLLSKQSYGNGDSVSFLYDNLDRQTEKKYNGNNSQRVTYSYGNNGSVAQITDYFTNSNTRFVYDLADRVVSQREYAGTGINGGDLLSYTNFTYADKTNYLTGIKHFSPLGTQNIGYRYGSLKDGEMPDQIYSVSWNGNEKVKYTYDGLGRLETKKTANFENKYTYEDVTLDYNGEPDSCTTTLVKSVETPSGTLTYAYDKLGNILSVSDGTYTTSYEYDSLNQLTRVNDEKAGKTTTYSYTNGNITECKEYEYTPNGKFGEPLNTKTWTYGNNTWSDLLTNFNGTPITYDEIGNPLTIGNKNLSWLGRQLQSVNDGENTYEYTYNGDGLRTSKTVNGEKTEYFYNGSILAGQKTGDDTLVFMYDNNSDIFGFIYNDTEYYYIKNAQNDVIAIADKDGNVLVNYTYDAWGKIISITADNNRNITDLKDDIFMNRTDLTTGESGPVLDENGNPVTEASLSVQLARINPILYRSYYYDKETEWYYLKTRYYSADMCRFINADGIIQTGQGVLDKNMFAYCMNNPANMVDSEGDIAAWIIALGIISLCTVIGGIIGYMKKDSAYKNAQSNSQKNKASSSNDNSNSNKNKTSNDNTKDSSSKKTNSSLKKRSSDKNTSENNEKLKPKEIAMNVFIGATMGMAVGGALVALGGVACAVYLGTAAVYGTISFAALAASRQVAAIGILAFNAEAMIFGPFYFVELEPIEWSE